jgi:hypothetical protein
MKFKFNFSFILFFILLAFTAWAGDGEWSNNARKDSQPYGEIFRFTCTVDSIDTLTSATFKLGKYDNVYWGSNRDTVSTMDTLASGAFLTIADKGGHVGRPFWIQYQATSAAGSPKITGYIEGSFDGSNWDPVDTLFTDLTSETRTVAQLNFNNKKYPQYRMKIFGVALNRSDTVFNAYLYAYQEEY